MSGDNPFNPGSGTPPPYLAGRETEQRLLLDALRKLDKATPQTNIVMYGPRGNGKTVLLNWFEKECDKADVVAIKTTPSTGLKSADALAELLLPRDWLPKEFSVGLQGVLSAGWTRPDTNAYGKLDDHLIEACRKTPRALLLDEAHTLDADVCQSLLNTCQMVSNTAPFLLVMAGTPGLTSFLMSAGATFVERSKMLGIGRLSERAAAEAIGVPLRRDGISIEEDTLDKVVEDAQRYPYFLQLWGEGLWETAAEQKVTVLTGAQAEKVLPDIEARREEFYTSRYRILFDDEPLLAAANAVAEAFRDKNRIDMAAVPKIIEDNLSETLNDGANRRGEAHRLNKELHRIDYVWNPSGSTWVEPGIFGFMTFIQSRAEREKRHIVESTPPVP